MYFPGVVFALGLGEFVADRIEVMGDRIRVIEDRIEVMGDRIRVIEDRIMEERR